MNDFFEIHTTKSFELSGKVVFWKKRQDFQFHRVYHQVKFEKSHFVWIFKVVASVHKKSSTAAQKSSFFSTPTTRSD